MNRWTQVAGAIAVSLILTERSDAKVGSYWKPLPPLPTPRQEVGVAGDDTHVYVIGECSSAARTPPTPTTAVGLTSPTPSLGSCTFSWAVERRRRPAPMGA